MHILSHYFNLRIFLSVADSFKIKALRFYYKYSQKTLPLYFDEMFTNTSDRHNQETRQQSIQILYTYPTRTDIGRKRMRHLLPEIINKIQRCITEKVSTHSFNVFSTYVKNTMISNYSHQENCYICHKKNWASFHCLVSISCMKFTRMTMTISIYVSISLFCPFSLLCMSHL